MYKDFEIRDCWQPSLLSFVKPEKVLFKIVNSYEQIYRQASMRLLTCESELAQLDALNTSAQTQTAHNTSENENNPREKNLITRKKAWSHSDNLGVERK